MLDWIKKIRAVRVTINMKIMGAINILLFIPLFASHVAIASKATAAKS